MESFEKEEQAMAELETLGRAGALLADLAAQRGKVAVVFDPASGWCITDDIDVLQPKMGPTAPEYRVIAYESWVKPTLEEAFIQALKIQASRAGQR